jgi:hypothetical protein
MPPAIKLTVRFALLFLPLTINACGWSTFNNRTTDPLVLDYIKDHEFPDRYRYQVLSTDASRRTIIFRFQNAELAAKDQPETALSQPYVCGEPPPDALQAYANAITAALKANSNVSANLGSNLATAAAPLLYRSQGLQFARDSLFFLCQARMNGVFSSENNKASTDEKYFKLWRETNIMALQMVHDEIPALIEAAKRNPTTVQVTNSPPSGQQKSDNAGQTGAAGPSPANKPDNFGQGNSTTPPPASKQSKSSKAGQEHLTNPEFKAANAVAIGAAWREAARRAPTFEIKAALLDVADGYEELGKAIPETSQQLMPAVKLPTLK